MEIDCQEFAQRCFEVELSLGYDAALEQMCALYGITREQGIALLVEDDELNNGNC